MGAIMQKIGNSPLLRKTAFGFGTVLLLATAKLSKADDKAVIENAIKNAKPIAGQLMDRDSTKIPKDTMGQKPVSKGDEDAVATGIVVAGTLLLAAGVVAGAMLSDRDKHRG